MITYEEAFARITESIRPLPARPTALADCLGLVAAEDVTASTAVPPFRNSAMDGYALHFDDLVDGATLRIVDTVRAGQAGSVAVRAGEAAQIATGAMLPEGADTVVPMEDCAVDGPVLSITGDVRRGQCIRPAGQDVAERSTVLRAGQVMTPAAIAMCAAVGRASVDVHRRPRIGIIATGDELVEPGCPLGPGKIYNSNAYGLAAQAVESGAVVDKTMRAADDRDALRAAFDACVDCDIVITSGGVSVGQFDYVKDIFAERGAIDFWRVAIRPGKPLVHGRWGDRLFFGLPGNPTSSMVTFELFVRPVIRKMLGYKSLNRPIVEARLEERLRHEPGRRSFMRAVLRRSGGELTVCESGGQDSGMLHALVAANALIVIPEDVESVDAGASVRVLVLAGDQSI